jgi:hypothetical protein
MQVRFLETAEPGLRWFKQYYAARPELNWPVAREVLRATIAQLKANPYSGHTFDDFTEMFEKKLSKTAFSLLYTVHDQTIFVIALRDQRGLRSAAALRAFTAELRRKYGLD